MGNRCRDPAPSAKATRICPFHPLWVGNGGGRLIQGVFLKTCYRAPGSPSIRGNRCLAPPTSGGEKPSPIVGCVTLVPTVMLRDNHEKCASWATVYAHQRLGFRAYHLIRRPQQRPGLEPEKTELILPNRMVHCPEADRTLGRATLLKMREFVKYSSNSARLGNGTGPGVLCLSKESPGQRCCSRISN